MTRLISVLLIAVLLTGCTVSPVQLLDAIITAAEILIPVIPGLGPTDAPAVTAYLNAVLNITDGLLANGITTAGIAQAVADFQNLVVPQLSQQVSPQVLAWISAVAQAVAVFLQDYHTAKPALSARVVTSINTLSKKDQRKVFELRGRIEAAQAKLKQ